MTRNSIFYIFCLLAAAFSLFSGLREEYFIVKLIFPFAIIIAGYLFYNSQKGVNLMNEENQKKTEDFIINVFGGSLIAVTISSPELWKVTLPLFLLLIALSVYWHKLDKKAKE